MGRLRKIALAAYVVAGAATVAVAGASLLGPYGARIADALGRPVARAVAVACLAVVGLHVLASLGAVVFTRPEPEAVRLDGNPDIQVALPAIASVARAAVGEFDVLLEDVRVRPVGRARGEALVELELIAFDRTGLEGLAHRIQQRVTEACAATLGVEAARVRVRFLPSKTVTATKEVSR